MNDRSKNFFVKHVRIGSKTGKIVSFKSIGFRLLFPIIGFMSLLWFLIRVIPKPSRATYPCMKAAAPLAFSFVVWATGLFSSVLFFKKAKTFFQNSRYVMFSLASIACVVLFLIPILQDTQSVSAISLFTLEEPNTPIGEAKGIFPGRVVWVYDPDATDENCTNVSGDYWYQDDNTNQAVVNQMFSDGLQTMTGKTTDAAAWDAIFHYYNKSHGRGDVGYTAGEKIVIKTNLNGLGNWLNKMSNINTAPQLCYALLDQLINVAGVAQANIGIGDPSHMDYYTPMMNKCHTAFPGVKIWGNGSGQTPTPASDENVLFSSDGAISDPLPQCYLDATYMINVPVLKKHHRAGITLSCKNHFGSTAPYTGGAWQWHPYLVSPNATGVATNGNYGVYRCLVDIMGHKDLGGKTIFHLIDGIWGSVNWGHPPVKYRMAPFNNDWPNSLFLSQDPVAIESVGFDFLYEEFDENHPTEGSPTTGDKGPFPRWPGVDDYLHQAADPANWPSNFEYDPEDDGTILTSMGTHEHWNNAAEKRYSRNLGIGEGIELLAFGIPWIGPPDPSSIDFSYGLVGEPKNKQVVVTNPGSVDLTVSSIDVTGTHADLFSCNQAPFTLSSGEEQTIDIVFSPDTLGDFEASLNIYSDGGDIQVELSGTGMLAEPLILSVTDVPEDQGNWVEVSWYPSYYDLTEEMTHYIMWEKDLQNQWDSVGVTPATQENPYVATLSTFGNKTPSSDFWSSFRIAVHTIDFQVIYSAIDSGYSVDNLPPDVPTGLGAVVVGESTVDLSWHRNTDDDLTGYKLYRDLQSDFDPTGTEPIVETGDTTYTDNEVETNTTYYYRICAVDLHENESGFSESVSVEIGTAVDGVMAVPAQFFLEQNYPNPFNASTRFYYELPIDSDVFLEIFNMQGQKVKTLVHEKQSMGEYIIQWNGQSDNLTDVPSGIYLYRLRAGEHVLTKKLTLLK